MTKNTKLLNDHTIYILRVFWSVMYASMTKNTKLPNELGLFSGMQNMYMKILIVTNNYCNDQNHQITQ